MTSLLTLATRVESLDGPDREVDALVGVALGIFVRDTENAAFGPIYARVEPEGLCWPGNGGGYALVPEWTASLDAVCALIAEKLPGWAHAHISEGLRGCIGYVHNNETAFVGIGSQRNPNRIWVECRAATPALGLLAAALRALASPPDAISDRAEKESRHG